MKMHADEAELDPPLVRALLAEQFPRWADLPLSRLASSGTENAMFRLGEDLVARLPRRASAAPDVRLEQRWLPRLAPELPVAIPVPVGAGRPGPGFAWPWSIFRWLPGANPAPGELTDPEALAVDLAEFLLALRRITPDGPVSVRPGPLSTRDEVTREAIGQLHGEVDVPAVTALWDKAMRAPEWTGDPVWVHGDISPGNLLVEHGRLSAVIDFGCTGLGDPAVDLIVAWNLLPATARTPFREALAADEATWWRGIGWALSISLIQLPYYLHTNPGLVASSRHVIREVLAACG